MKFTDKIPSHPGRQRRKQAFSSANKIRKSLSVHFNDKLMLKYGLRSIPVRKGDVVQVVRGSFKGHPQSKVLNVNYRSSLVEIDDATISKSDKKKVPRRFHPSNLVIVKINLTDPWRQRYLKDHGIEIEEQDIVAEEELVEEEELEEDEDDDDEDEEDEEKEEDEEEEEDE